MSVGRFLARRCLRWIPLRVCALAHVNWTVADQPTGTNQNCAVLQVHLSTGASCEMSATWLDTKEHTPKNVLGLTRVCLMCHALRRSCSE